MNCAERDAVMDAMQDRWWRFRCGEPNLANYPIRCKRSLNHEAPHVGLIGNKPVAWAGTGNRQPANHETGQYKCWGGCGRP